MTINTVMIIRIAAPGVLEGDGDYGCRVDSISPCQSCTGPDLGWQCNHPELAGADGIGVQFL